MYNFFGVKTYISDNCEMFVQKLHVQIKRLPYPIVSKQNMTSAIMKI